MQADSAFRGPGEVTGGQACSPGQPALACSLLGSEPGLAWLGDGCLSRASGAESWGGFLRLAGLPFAARKMQEAEQGRPRPLSVVLRVFCVPAALCCPGRLPLATVNWEMPGGDTAVELR